MSDLASQFKKIIMACTFLDQVDCLLTVACASLAKDPYLVVTAIFQTWLQWFKTAGSGVEWLELANIERECCQLYEQYKREEWVHPFDVHFALVNPSLEFLIDDLTVGMMVSALAVASASDTTKEQIKETFSDKCLATLIYWQKALMVVDTGLGAGVVLMKAKGKVTVLLEKQQEFKCMQGVEEAAIGGSRVTRVKSREVVESNKDDDGNDSSNGNDDVPLAQK
ncbi:hypothetical protein C0989_008024 [Termitomyces sp. Mn162]|nr:hypothetical protein C0989_008024 [Termitomyces sp. Mn162]